jgi:cysteinyl-tRNA synthetase
MSLRVYNSLSRRIEPFVPLDPPRVGMYVCGPTVYGHSHLGHAKSYVSFDAIVRWLRFSGYDVNYVQNITDVGHLTDDADQGEDKIIAEARRRGLHPMAVVETFMRSYFEDMDALNLLRPDISPRAGGHIPEQIENARLLIEKGHAYEANGSVYFDVGSFPEYGKLAGRNVQEMAAGARVEVNPEKRHPADFALWKRAEPGHIMRWPSPWGEGFPGWHLECSVMSRKYLGDTLDIHGGGLDNKFPHHECEIAQGECTTGKPFARYWLHNNMCTLNGQKMSKSIGNTVLLKDLFHAQAPIRDREGNVLFERRFEPVVVRHFLLTSHYRQPLDFSSEALQAAESGNHKLRDALAMLRDAAGDAEPGATDAQTRPEGRGSEISDALAQVEQGFTAAMNEDFNTAAALAVVFGLAKQAEGWVREGVPAGSLAAARILMQRLTADALGLQWPQSAAGDASRTGDLVQLLIDLRNEARATKNFALADQVRNRLDAIGIELRDGPDGTEWKARSV